MRESISSPPRTNKRASFQLSAMNSEIRTTRNYSNDWLDQSAASYMLTGYSPQPFTAYISRIWDGGSLREPYAQILSP
ncbi:hypothetical protein TNCV_4044971 [Trichonephila clavipes]|nr:hypothetical protein TNCV_4044971 [Trichonephila clavipes]